MDTSHLDEGFRYTFIYQSGRYSRDVPYMDLYDPEPTLILRALEEYHDSLVKAHTPNPNDTGRQATSRFHTMAIHYLDRRNEVNDVQSAGFRT